MRTKRRLVAPTEPSRATGTLLSPILSSVLNPIRHEAPDETPRMYESAIGFLNTL